MNKPNLKIYNEEEVKSATLEYFKGDDLATSVWMSKYALTDKDGNFLELTPEDMHWRITKELLRIESKYQNPMEEQEIFDLLKDFKYVIPAGSPMAGIGNNNQISSLSNCFVTANDYTDTDSYGAILRTDEELIQISKRRGGVGGDLSYIRPQGASVTNAAKTSTGIIPFMERYSNSIREVGQSGRRGALMLTISINHPESPEFIDSKLDLTKITGANISVRVTDEFMENVKNDNYHILRFPVEFDFFSDNYCKEKIAKAKENEIIFLDKNKINPEILGDTKNNTFVIRKVKAKDIWNKMMKNAWQSAEPGILYWDQIIRESPADCYADVGYKTLSTNPCGELPLSNKDSCRLTSLNLLSYVKEPFTENAYFDFELLKKHVRYAQKFMDDLIDLEGEKILKIINKVENDPEPMDLKKTEYDLWNQIYKATMNGRRTGLGVTAVGDMLASLGLRYGSKEATAFCVQVFKTIAINSYISSIKMAKERGPFNVWEKQKEKDNPFINRVFNAIKEEYPNEYDEILEIYNEYGRRNIANLTIAPGGSVSIMTRTTSGIEPVFMPLYTRRRKVEQDALTYDFIDATGDKFVNYVVVHENLLNWMTVNGYTKAIEDYSEQKLNEILEESPYHKATAMDLDWEEKVIMQSAINQWVDHSISCTHNLPSDVSVETVSNLYMTAWETGAKGCTIYRDGSRSGVLVSSEEKTPQNQSSEPIKRPKKLKADVIRFKNNSENWVAFVGLTDDGVPYEIFTGIADDENGIVIPRNISEGYIIKTKNGQGEKSYDFEFQNRKGFKVTAEGLNAKFNQEFWNYARMISGFLRYQMPIEQIINVIEGLDLDSESINTWKNGVVRTLKRYVKDGTKVEKTCSECGQESLIYQDGCVTCSNCGSSKCG